MAPKKQNAPQSRGRRRAGGRPLEKGTTIGLATRFQPGKSGNPGGLTKEAAAARDEAREIAAKAAPRMMRRAIRLARHASQEDGVQLGAVKEVLDRGLGKSSQPLEVGGPGGGPIPVEVSSLSDEELAAALLGKK